jgi:hypothetical protein
MTKDRIEDRLGTNPYTWFVSVESIPLTRVKAIHFKAKSDRDWRVVDHPWRFLTEVDSEILGFEFGSAKAPETNFFEWTKSFTDEEGRVGKLAMYRTLSSDTYQALLANGWQQQPEPPQDVNPGTYRTYELRTASLPLDIVKELDAVFPLTRYSGEIDRPKLPEVKSPKLAILADPNDDELAESILASAAKTKPLPATPNAKRMTTDVRYVITEDTFRRYPVDDTAAEKAELIEAGLWKLPHSDDPYTIRLKAYALAEFLDRFEGLASDGYGSWDKREAELKRGTHTAKTA